MLHVNALLCLTKILLGCLFFPLCSLFFKWKKLKYSSHFYLFLVTLVMWACDIYHLQGFYKCEINQPEWSWNKLVMYKLKVLWNSLFCLMLLALLEKRNRGGKLGNKKQKLIEQLRASCMDLLILTIFIFTCPRCLMNCILSTSLPPLTAPAPLLRPPRYLSAFHACFLVFVNFGLVGTVITAKRTFLPPLQSLWMLFSVVEIHM